MRATARAFPHPPTVRWEETPASATCRVDTCTDRDGYNATLRRHGGWRRPAPMESVRVRNRWHGHYGPSPPSPPRDCGRPQSNRSCVSTYHSCVTFDKRLDEVL